MQVTAGIKPDSNLPEIFNHHYPWPQVEYYYSNLSFSCPDIIKAKFSLLQWLVYILEVIITEYSPLLLGGMQPNYSCCSFKTIIQL